MLVILPLAPPEISVIFRPGLVSPGKNISVKNAVAISFYVKNNWRGIWIYIFGNYTNTVYFDTCTLPSVFICLFRYSLLNNLILTSDLSIAFFPLDLNECSYNQCDSPREICVNFPGTSFCNCVAGNFLIQNSCTGGKDF